MSIWMKVVTAVRGGVNEAGEAIADNQALRILDQEIRDADSDPTQARLSYLYPILSILACLVQTIMCTL